MPFIMSQDASEYWSRLNRRTNTGELKTKFDLYYLCSLIGFSKKELGKLEGDEFVDLYPKEYANSSDQLIALLIATEIDRQGIDPNDRKVMEDLMKRLVDSNSPIRLSKEGENLLNRYAAKGFEEIQNEIPDPNIKLDTFLIKYYEKFFEKF